MPTPTAQLWENLYRRRPYWTLPWTQHPDDFFRSLVEKSTIRPGTALDLGCGTGEKDIFLAKKGFNVTAVDISPTAITQAKALADKEGVRVHFLVADDLSLPFPSASFDFVLDFSNFHGVPEEDREKYLREVGRLTHPARLASESVAGGPASQLFLRVLSKRDPRHTAGFYRSALTHTITYTFDRKDIESLYKSHFKITCYQETDFELGGKKIYMDEYLMEKKE